MKNLIEKFKAKTVLVIGDIMLDKYVWGDVTRISPEAPVPVVKVKHESFAPGGAGNCAANVAALGAKCYVAGIACNDDEAGKTLFKLLKEQGVDCSLAQNKACRTIEKVRVIGASQQLVRYDYDNPTPLLDYDAFLKGIKPLLSKIDVIIISDYQKGLLNEDICKKIIKLGPKVIVDIKPKNIGWFKGAFLIKPNKSDAELLTGISCDNDINAGKAACVLRERLDANIIITRGGSGITLCTKEGITKNFPTESRQVYDVTGAGDTVTATIALAVASGASLDEAAILGNLAGGLKVTKVGTATVSNNELGNSFEKTGKEILSLKEAVEQRERWRKQGKKVVFTNGCFDIIHAGHVSILKRARAQGDVLVVGLNSDESVTRLKGPTRPIIKQDDRAEVLAALECVDAVVIFNEDTPVELIKALKPDIHVKGGDYTKEKMPEWPVVESYGGKIVILPLVEGLSTTNIAISIANGKKSPCPKATCLNSNQN